MVLKLHDQFEVMAVQKGVGEWAEGGGAEQLVIN